MKVGDKIWIIYERPFSILTNSYQRVATGMEPYAWTDHESEVGDAINFAKANGAKDNLQVEIDYIKEVHDDFVVTSRDIVCEIH